MSLTETNLISVLKRQYFYKLKAYMGLFNGLAAVQLMVFLFTFGRAGMMGTNGDGISVTVNRYSGDVILIFTIAWVVSISILFSTQAFRNGDFTFVSNRLSSNLSNIGFLLTVSVAAGVTVPLYGAVVRLIIYFTQGSQNIMSENFFLVPQEFLLGIAAASLYMILFSAIGYLIGILVQYSKLFIPLLPVLFLGVIFLQRTQSTNVLPSLFVFFAHENSIPLFALKVLAAGMILFAAGSLISNRTEVRQ